jgi:hypothetical protein
MLVSVRVATVALVGGLAVSLARPDAAAAALLLNGGILFLMATPLLRVLVAAAEGARVGDRFLLVMIALVAVLLGLTLALARGA